MRYVLALDQGTTSSRALLFDRESTVRAVAQREFDQIFPQPGWVEHNPEQIVSSQIVVAREALAQAGAKLADVAAIGIANQRETTIVWNRETGKPIYNAIVWQDRRTADFCERLRSEGNGPMIQQRTGLLIDSYFSASKISWILDSVPGARSLAEAGKLAFGTVDSWLVWKLTGGRVHATDVSNASRTMLFNIHTGDWDGDLLNLFRVPRSMMPEVRSSSEAYGEVSENGLEGIPLAGIAGDQQAALFGQRCTRPGLTKNTYGTGCFMLQNTGRRAVPSSNRLVTTVAWRIGNVTEYALEGSVFVGGAVVQWLRDGLGLIRKSEEIEALAQSVPDNGGVYFVPAFVGLGAPHWDSYARGSIFGLTRGTTAGHLARAAVESIAYQVADLLDAMRRDSGDAVEELRVDGGAAANDSLMRFQADILGVPVVRPAVTETTAMGAAYLAAMAVGFWGNEVGPPAGGRDRHFEPRMPASAARSLRERWSEAVSRAKNWESAH
ncbi:glycerol kinase [Candidatus Sulfotelmatobacter kueseliae]|uniref:Glycerol kinase n=1 Tax=Candidatus Sulfotelmatobacter kueseliae TaxID=2042962 RepID=A0A2U3L6W2_9BACT|nr:glycerol kinase [Candidatus Sulfotelmatobacter kueseliae]